MVWRCHVCSSYWQGFRILRTNKKEAFQLGRLLKLDITMLIFVFIFL